MIGLAGERNHDWLRSHGIVPVAYGDGQVGRLREVAGGKLDAFIDTFGGGYVNGERTGVAPERINTIIDYAAVQRLRVHGQGTHAIATAPLLAEIAGLVAAGSLEIPIARTFPLDLVRDAYRELAERHTRGSCGSVANAIAARCFSRGASCSANATGLGFSRSDRFRRRW